MKKALIAFLIYVFTYSANGHQEYTCPNLPANFYIGEQLANDWFIGFEKKNQNIEIIKREKEKKLAFFISTWASFTTGIREGSFEGYKNYISCCTFSSGKKNDVCAYKYVKEQNCKAMPLEEDPVKFICKKWPKTKMQAWMEQDRKNGK